MTRLENKIIIIIIKIIIRGRDTPLHVMSLIWYHWEADVNKMEIDVVQQVAVVTLDITEKKKEGYKSLEEKMVGRWGQDGLSILHRKLEGRFR